MEFSEGNEGVLCLQPLPLPSVCFFVSLPPALLTPDPTLMSVWSLAVVRKMWQVPSMAYYFSTFHTVFGTAKVTPLLQVLCLDAMEVGPRPSDLPASFLPRGDRYDLQRICLGDELCGTLAKLKLFMIGCGAIGCELMKNFALLGISAGADSAMVITDNDVIEKSNLNRQFLFRPQHIQQPKSVVAAASVLAINPGMKITAHQHKVGPATTETVYTDAFFESRDIVVNALVRLPPPPLTAQPQDVRPLSYGRLMCSLTLFRAAFPLSAFRITCKRGCLSTRGASHAADRCWSRAPWGPRATCRSSCRT